MSKIEKNLEVLLTVYNRLIPLIERGLTGKITLHCYQGEVKKLETNKIEPISPDMRDFKNKKIAGSNGICKRFEQRKPQKES